MDSKPNFRYMPSGELVLKATEQADLIRQDFKKPKTEASQKFRAKKAPRVHQDAVARVTAGGGDPSDHQLVLSQTEIQFGEYRGHTFKWLLENDVGYILSILISHQVSYSLSMFMSLCSCHFF